MKLNFKQTLDNRWICYDDEGRRAKGLTKEIAENNYYIIHNVKKNIEENTNKPKVDFEHYFKEVNINED